MGHFLNIKQATPLNSEFFYKLSNFPRMNIEFRTLVNSLKLNFPFVKIAIAAAEGMTMLESSPPIFPMT